VDREWVAVDRHGGEFDADRKAWMVSLWMDCVVIFSVSFAHSEGLKNYLSRCR